MGLTQAQFGKLIGKAGTIISNLECDRIGVSDAVWDRVMKIDEKTIAVKRTGHSEMKKTSHSETQKKAPTEKKKGHTITENIIVLRRFLGLSQTAFAASISRSPGFISNLEVGIGKASQETINRICNVHGVSEKWLRTGEEPMFVPGREQYPAETENIRNRMKEVRRKAGLTQEQFAQAISYSKNQVNFVERGRANPSEEYLRAVSRRFGVSMTWLKTGMEGQDDDISDIIDWIKSRPDVIDELKKRMGEEGI